MSYKCFKVEIADNIAHIIMSRPEKRNAMIEAFWTELPDIIRDIDANSKARVIVLSAEGPVFSAGMDIAMFSDIAGPADKNHPQYGASFYSNVKRLQDSFTAIESFITIYEIIVGMTADVGTFPRILNHMPEGVVRELAYTGRKMMAEECKSHGQYCRMEHVYADTNRNDGSYAGQRAKTCR